MTWVHLSAGLAVGTRRLMHLQCSPPLTKTCCVLTLLCRVRLLTTTVVLSTTLSFSPRPFFSSFSLFVIQRRPVFVIVNWCFFFFLVLVLSVAAFLKNILRQSTSVPCRDDDIVIICKWGGGNIIHAFVCLPCI